MFIKTCENFLVNINHIVSFEYQELNETRYEVYAALDNGKDILLRTFESEKEAIVLLALLPVELRPLAATSVDSHVFSYEVLNINNIRVSADMLDPINSKGLDI